METQKKQKGLLGRGATLFAIAFILILSTLFSMTAFAATDTTQPTVVMTSPANNALDIATNAQIMVRFSEPMDPSTINSQTIQVLQRTTPQDRTISGEYRFLAIPGTVTYSGLWAIFTPTTPLSPNQEFGNVYTVTATDGAMDLAGNRLAQTYMFSFSTGLIPFFTDSSTAQLYQTPLSIVPTPVPVTTTPIPTSTTTTAPATSAFPWVWLIVGLIVLFVVALLIAMNMGSSDKETAIIPAAVVVAKKKNSKPSPFGDVSPVIDIEGVGPEYAARLNNMGIKNTKQLWEANANKVANTIRVPVHTIQSWQRMAELISVNDIGPQYAELLERSGIHSIAQLKAETPTKLLAAVRKKQDSLKINIQGNHLGQATVSHWIDEAKAHKATITAEAEAAEA